MILHRVVTPHFVAGFVASPEGRVVEAAPVLKYLKGWAVADARIYARRKGWTVTTIISKADGAI